MQKLKGSDDVRGLKGIQNGLPPVPVKVGTKKHVVQSLILVFGVVTSNDQTAL